MLAADALLRLHQRPGEIMALDHASDPSDAVRWHDQKKRRSQILAAFRGMLQHKDADDIRLSEVAEHVGISVQTIYNIVGNRKELIGASIEEWGTAVGQLAYERAIANGENPILTSLAVHWEAVIQGHPWVVRSVHLELSSPELQNRFWRHGAQISLRYLEDAERAGAIAAGVHLPTLARQIAYCSNMTICNWIRHRYDPIEFRRDLHSGPGLMLKAALLGDELDKLNDTLAGLDCRHGFPLNA